MPRSDGPENLKILKKRQLGVDFGPCRQTFAVGIFEVSPWKVNKIRLGRQSDPLGIVQEIEI